MTTLLTYPIPGPRWRGVSLAAAAERLGVSPSATARAADHGRIETRRRGDVRYVTLAELRRYVATPVSWVARHPRDIVDPELRDHALTAWEAAGSPACYAASDLMVRYHIASSTLWRWRRRGWPGAPDAWHWHGGARGGDWWLVWPGPLPAPPEQRQAVVHPKRRAHGAARRQAVVNAVLRRGGSPGRGRGGFWPAVAAELGISPHTARRLWWEHRQQEDHHVHAAD